MSKKKGLQIGNYRITPLGLGAIAVLIIAIAAVIIIPMLNTTSIPDGQKPMISVEPATAAPTAVTTAQPQPVATEAPTPEPTATPEPRSATIRVLGEIALQNEVLESAKQEDGSYDFTEIFSEIASYASDADYTIGDVEGSFGGTMDVSGENTKLVSPTSIIDALQECGVDMLMMANDHVLDGSFEDLQASMDALKDAGIDYVGAATSQEEKDTPKIVEINGINVGFIAYTESLGSGQANASSDVLAYGVNLATKKTDPAADIQKLKDNGAEFVIAIMNWGEMLSSTATETQLSTAKLLASAGADVIIGYNPHVIQPVKLGSANGRKALCIFCPGNFLSAVRSQPGDSGMIFEFTIQEGENGYEIVNPKYIPTYVCRSVNDDETVSYQVMNVGLHLSEQPEGMDYEQYSRMKSVYAEAQSIIGSDAEIVSE